MREKVAYIIDDDPTKQSSKYCGIRIISLADADPIIKVIIAFNNPEMSLAMKKKLSDRRPELTTISL